MSAFWTRMQRKRILRILVRAFMLTFQVERFQDIAKELAPLFVHHWNESALDQEKIKLAPNWKRYGAMQNEGILHIVTVRCLPDDHESREAQKQVTANPPIESLANGRGKLVGYYFAMILPHLHYSTAGPMAYPDAYFILPQFRKGGAGAKLLAEMERTLWEKGIVKIYLSTKVHDDHGPLFERMGYRLTDKVYTKIR